MKFLKLIGFTAVLLTGMSAYRSVHAGISPLAFKNVGKCFKPGFEYYAPMLGSVALTTGLIENLRFYNVEASYNEVDRTRDYIKDTAPANDPVMEIILILFPSPAGQLTAETTHSTSFGKNCEEKHVAALLNFAYVVRKHCKGADYKGLPGKVEELETLLQQIGEKSAIDQSFPQGKFKSTKKNDLLFAIAKAIEGEEKLQAGVAETSFYPKYIVEQVLNAFFCHKFADQEAIKKLLGSLHEEIVDKTKIIGVNDSLKKDEVSSALKKIEENTFDLDTLWLALNRNIFDRVIPYENGKEPISNGSAQLYKRDDKEGILASTSFADCVEVTLRHIINCFLYDGAKHTFNLSEIKKHMLGKADTYIKNLYHFYEAVQSPDKANAGNSVCRSSWNKVVADLGNPVAYRKPFINKSSELNNELDSGMFNILYAFKKLFSLDLDPEPLYQEEKKKQFKEDGEKWVIKGLEKLCGVLNPSLNCNVKLSNVGIDTLRKDITGTDTRTDLLGDITLDVNNKSGKKLFSFKIHVLSKHLYMGKININQEGLTILSTQQEKVIIDTTANTSYQDTIFTSLLLLDPILRSFKNIALMSPLYQLFSGPVNDSNSIISALTCMYDLSNKSLIKPEMAALILKHILDVFPWNDFYAIQAIMDPLIKLTELIVNPGNIFAKTLKDGVKGCAVGTDSELHNYLSFFPNTSFLISKKTCNVTNLNLSTKPKLKYITFVKAFNLRSIEFAEAMDDLEELDLSSSGIKKLDLPACPKLKDMYLSDTKNLETIAFTAALNNLEKINLHESGIKKLDLPVCPKLEVINLEKTKNLETINFAGAMDSLKNIFLWQSGIKKLTLPACPELKVILLGDTKNLETIIFAGAIDNLEGLNLRSSGIKKLDLPACPKLKDMYLSDTKNLETIAFTEALNSLRYIDLDSSGIKKLDLPVCPKLEEINLQHTKNLVTATFAGAMDSLKNIFLSESAIKKLDLRACPKLKRIHLQKTKNLETVTFTGNMDSLETINARKSGIKKIIGIEHCPKLDKTKLPKEIELVQSTPSNSLEGKLTLLKSSLQDLQTNLKELADKLVVLKNSLSH